MRAAAVVAALAGVLVGSRPSAQPQPPFGRVLDARRCDEVQVAGDYALCVRVLHAGTRSEGRVARLYRLGHEVPDPPGGTALDAGGGLWFVFRGWARPHLWSVSGWVAERR